MIEKTLRLLGIYTLYERWLERTVSAGEIPQHLAVILDGNRRWAKSAGLPPSQAYRYGADKVEDLLRWCLKIGIKIVTLYVLSLENIVRRPSEELEEIYRLLMERAERFLKDETVWREKVRFRVIGRLDYLPAEVAESLRRLERETMHHDRLHLNIAVAYGGRAEIVDAVRKICGAVAAGEVLPHQIDEEVIERNLYTNGLPKPDPDLVIRTSGEERISNFLLWQIAYSELVFLDVYWPSFRKIDLLRAIRTYQQRSRRFGG
ncbi:MAG: polyprenyl diphosphate synthase [Nitrososphaerota archaeon]|nr:polyprenyl diphosphate synthase [Candidatus Calditenuaceae archaeon]MDW8073802.1 polyprenyl diphosphate synthase [Nitrososphaerota archaeon]